MLRKKFLNYSNVTFHFRYHNDAAPVIYSLTLTSHFFMRAHPTVTRIFPSHFSTSVYYKSFIWHPWSSLRYFSVNRRTDRPHPLVPVWLHVCVDLTHAHPTGLAGCRSAIDCALLLNTRLQSSPRFYLALFSYSRPWKGVFGV